MVAVVVVAVELGEPVLVVGLAVSNQIVEGRVNEELVCVGDVGHASELEEEAPEGDGCEAKEWV